MLTLFATSADPRMISAPAGSWLMYTSSLGWGTPLLQLPGVSHSLSPASPVQTSPKSTSSVVFPWLGVKEPVGVYLTLMS